MERVRVRALIFDFDGTLADTYKMFEELVYRFAPLFTRVKISDADIKKARKMPVTEIIKEYRISPLRIFWHRRRVLNYLKARMADIKPIPGVILMLKALKAAGIKMFILTSNSKENVNAFLKNNQIEVFDGVYARRDLFGKAAGIKKILQEWKLTEKEAVFYVGDETRDIEAAKKAGIGAIAVSWGYSEATLLKKFTPDIVVSKPEEMLKFARET
jgi:phosphoglycolate phosphatase